MVVQVINSKTKEVLPQVPPDSILRLSEDLNKAGGPVHEFKKAAAERKVIRESKMF
jgi:uncharacterized FlaG/YvyC family protein